MQMMKSLAIIALVSLSTIAKAHSQEEFSAFYIGSFVEKNGDHSGVELSLAGAATSHISGRISAVLYNGNNSEQQPDTFAGYSAAGYINFNQGPIVPYLGLGLFVGDTFNCSDYEKDAGLCYEQREVAFYPEVGVSFNLWNIKIHPFLRRYLDRNIGVSAKNAVGLYLGVAI